jgi:glyoxylase-like metal-dependent hydrolase (beta-lactamase superfamily II)
MAEVKILVEGFASGDFSDEEERTRATITLIEDGDIKIVVDPGVLKSQDILISALERNGLSVNDIDIVCITHSHINHYRNIGMFPEAKTLEFYGLWDKESVEDWNENFSEDIKIIKTPGHDKSSISLLVKTKNGSVAVVGDLFWKENYPEKDPYADSPEKLEESRNKILEISDWIIPGHGKIFKVKK